jgi:hypothetical protein
VLQRDGLWAEHVDPELVPGQVPRHGHDDLAVAAHDDAHPRVAERAGDPAHRPRVVALVEELEARLDGIARVGRERVGRERLRDAALARPAGQEALQSARAAARRLQLQRHADRPLADPPERIRLIDAELADPRLGPLRALVRDEPLAQ